MLHGTTDPMFPIEHGHALAREIEGARLVPGVGHQQHPPAWWDLAVSEIVENTQRGPSDRTS